MCVIDPHDPIIIIKPHKPSHVAYFCGGVNDLGPLYFRYRGDRPVPTDPEAKVLSFCESK